MSISQDVVNEACVRLGRGDRPAEVVRYVARSGGEMLDASRILTQCGFSLTEAKTAIDASQVWPDRASEEAQILDGLDSWDPAADED